jgi:hypothetical protein
LPSHRGPTAPQTWLTAGSATSSVTVVRGRFPPVRSAPYNALPPVSSS